MVSGIKPLLRGVNRKNYPKFKTKIFEWTLINSQNNSAVW